MLGKIVTLAYKSKPNPDGKTTYVEFVGVAKNWKEKEFFRMTCKITEYDPMLIDVSKKKWKRIHKNKSEILALYTDTMQDLYNKVKNGI